LCSIDKKANDALKKFLAKALGISNSSVIIVSGESDRHNRIRLVSDSAQDIVNVLD
jgi:uncharacterized protein YggU (UPF0235/DUF167 family)